MQNERAHLDLLERCGMPIDLETLPREVVLVDAARTESVQGVDVLQAIPSPRIAYATVDPFLLVHEASMPVAPEPSSVHPVHAHSQFDHLWYIASAAGDSPLPSGALLTLRTGREGAPAPAQAQAIVAARGQMRTVLLWVSRSPGDDAGEGTSQLHQPDDFPVLREGDAVVRVLAGDGSPVRLGTPALILDVLLPDGGTCTAPVPFDFNAFVYMLDGEAKLGSNAWRVKSAQCAVLGVGKHVTVADARPGARLLLMGGRPYVGGPVIEQITGAAGA